MEKRLGSLKKKCEKNIPKTLLLFFCRTNEGRKFLTLTNEKFTTTKKTLIILGS